MSIMLVFVYVKPKISASYINGLIVDSLFRHKKVTFKLLTFTAVPS